ncbi:STAS domain-containing protein [Pseudoflavonifractor phocaeensis]|uniref:STAS domain-containing protein n=1 Tax=Pseudoflavonifractor phocaeensis TaxID=1870988 RepID=UPI001959E461|nr:STAS domain-containing protein [Pseudoflavonifractor phocaeensis]MBM6870947.1 STAS domain-containing protein [Pseudoflavonifractor phocaeensis]MBM6939594.1 STAS domain-containing protein [Pseudoflavonifractor phocaeensis]
MSVTCTGGDRVFTASVSGEVDHHRARRIMEELEQAIDGGAPRQFTLDLSEVTFMDSSGIAVVLRVYRRVRALGGEMIVAHPPAQAAKVLKAAGIDRLIRFLE